MKTSIIITGQISGNFRLRNACLTFACECIKMQFNGFELKFPNKKGANETLKQAFNYLKNEEPEFYKEGGITYVKNYCLNYDASRAKIVKTN